MIEMEMRIDDQVDLPGISVHRFQPSTDFLPRLKADTEKPSESWAEPSSGVVLAIRMQPSVEQCPSFGMLNQEDRDRHGDVALATLH